MAERPSFSSSLVKIVLGGAAVRLALLVASIVYRDFLVTYRLPDDALYYFAIAQNLKHAFGGPLLTYDGLHATNGMHPLWVFIVSPAFLLGLGKWTAIYAAIALQSLLDCIAIWLIGLTVYETLDGLDEQNRRSASLIAAVLYAFNAVIVMRAINGLETTITAILLVLWFREVIRVLHGRRAGWLGIVIGLLLLARTDTVLLIAPVMLWLLAREDTRATTLRASIIGFVMLLPWLAWNLVNFGTIMQSSGLAVPFFAMKKYDVIYSPFGKTWHLLIEMLKNVLRPWLFAAVGIPLLALAVAWRGHRRDQRIQLIVLVSIGSALLLTVHSLFRGFIREWYVLMQIPLILIVFAVAAAVFAERFPIRCGGRRRFAIAVVVLLIPLALKQPYLSQKLTVDHGVPLVAELTKQHRVAALNSGYYGYFSSRPGSVVNLDGVVNFNAYEAIKQGNIRQLMNHDSVDYVLDLAGDLGGYKGLIDHHMLSDFTFDTAYHVPSLTEELALYRRTGR